MKIESIDDLRKIYRSVFSGPEGSIVLSDLFIFCGGLALSYVPDTHQTAFNEGMRNVLLRILNLSGIYTLDDLKERIDIINKEDVWKKEKK